MPGIVIDSCDDRPYGPTSTDYECEKWRDEQDEKERTKMNFDPAHIYEEVRLAGEDYADKKAAYEAYDDNSRSVLAEIGVGYMETCSSKAEAEMRALASSDYKEHLRAKQDARRAYLKAQVKYDSIRMLAELRRSQESTKRAELMMR